MPEQIFVAAAAQSDEQFLVTTLRRAGYEPITAEATPHPKLTFGEFMQREVPRSAAVVAVLPPVGSDRVVPATLSLALDAGIPVLLVETETSQPADGALRSVLTVRSNLQDDGDPIVTALDALVRHSNRQPRSTDHSDEPALRESRSRDWVERIRNSSADPAQFSRSVSMLLSEVGVELQAPPDRGIDFIGWSDALGAVVGNPFLIEIKSSGESAEVREQSERWLRASGVRTALILTSNEFQDPWLDASADGHSMLCMSAVELAGSLGSHSLRGAIEEALRRIGIAL